MSTDYQSTDYLAGFDPSTVTENTDVLLSPGLHPAMIVDINQGVSEKGNAWIRLTWKILGGNYEGESIKTMMFPNSSNEIAKQIYERQAKSLCTIFGLPKIETASDLMNKPLQINVKHAVDRATGDHINQINFFKSINDRGHGNLKPAGLPHQKNSKIPAPTWGQRPPPPPNAHVSQPGAPVRNPVPPPPPPSNIPYPPPNVSHTTNLHQPVQYNNQPQVAPQVAPQVQPQQNVSYDNNQFNPEHVEEQPPW